MSTKAFGIVFAVLVMGFIGGSQVNIFLLRRFNSQQIFFFALILQVLIGSIFFAGIESHLVGLKATLVLFLSSSSALASPIRTRLLWRLRRFRKTPDAPPH